jgi:hypothetical protein
MHPRAPTPAAPARPRHALRGLVCVLLLGWAGKPASARLKSPRTALADKPAPYLRVTGQVALRFQPVPPAPEAVARPVAGGPPLPAATPDAPAATTPTPPVATPASPDVILPEPAKAPAVEPPPIIPDELRPRVQAEDFLPFFQFPGAPVAGDVIIPPSPPHHATPSTATYRQKP